MTWPGIATSHGARRRRPKNLTWFPPDARPGQSDSARRFANSPYLMNIDALLDPISADSLCGEDLSFSLEFDAVLEKRREDDPTLARGEWVKTLKVADWEGVAAQCEELLLHRTKDLRVAGWLADALGRTRGMAGLADGLTLCAGLCEDYWEWVHPAADDGDVEQRSGAIAWLLGQVDTLVQHAVVLHGGGRRLSLRDIDGARALAQSIGRGLIDASAAAAAGALTLDDVTRVHAVTPREFLSASVTEVLRALAALAQLEQVVDRQLGADGPGFAAARKALDNALASVQRFARDGGAETPGVVVTRDEAPVRRPDAPDRPSPEGPLQTRAQALQQLRTVAEFFRRTEPHSPVAYLAEKAAKWGEMPLHDWLRIVMKDPTALAQVEEQLGVDPRPVG